MLYNQLWLVLLNDYCRVVSRVCLQRISKILAGMMALNNPVSSNTSIDLATLALALVFFQFIFCKIIVKIIIV